ncbi:T-cell-specific surface glycoprotein CD28 [Epinephelus fuscoguttatus]|uniref:T-cell-specific surface glycoprotein CD28 n=1 Tax=Epinephelus fuscoguttatus TaxID=293821 RepID=UPI0020D18CD6|nr:T-cell-specific surface glycoprotein CD28 [Epinephelus fuscoguttatus]
MRACWVFVILLWCRFSHATESQSVCKDQLKIACVAPGHNVSVPCPKLTTQDVTFYLLKEEEVIYELACIRNNATSDCEQSNTGVGVELQENTENKSAGFTLTGVNASSYGIYRCEVHIMFPPPLRKVPSTLSILVRVKGHQCTVNKTYNIKPVIEEAQKDGFLWIWILGIVVLGVYGIIVTIVAIIIWAKWRQSDSQCDYMNTKPKATRDRKKKRGVQIPIPRHF